MAWTTPLTWADSTVYTQTHFDQQLKDNLGFLYSPPSCLTRSNADQNLSHNTNTNLNMQTENWDTDSIHGATQYRHDINTAGTYMQIGSGSFSISSTAGGRSVFLQENGSTRTGETLIFGVPTIANTGLQVGHTGLMTTSDYVDLVGWQNSGGTLAVVSGTVWMLTHWCGNP